MQSPSLRLPSERVAGLLMLLTGMLHASVTQEHLQEWWGYGLFFVVAGVAQAGYGIALFHQQRPRPAFFWAGIAGNAFLVATYVVSRTYGVPVFGPSAGRVEEVAALDVLTKLLEAGAIVALAVRLRRR